MSTLRSKYHKFRSVITEQWEQHRQVLLMLLPLLFFFPMVKVIQLLQPDEPLDQLRLALQNENYEQLYDLSNQFQADYPLDKSLILHYLAVSETLLEKPEKSSFLLLLIHDKAGYHMKRAIGHVLENKPDTEIGGFLLQVIYERGEAEYFKEEIREVFLSDSIWDLTYLNKSSLFQSLSVSLPNRVYKLKKDRLLYQPMLNAELTLKAGGHVLVRKPIEMKNQSREKVHYLVYTDSGEQGFVHIPSLEFQHHQP